MNASAQYEDKSNSNKKAQQQKRRWRLTLDKGLLCGNFLGQDIGQLCKVDLVLFIALQHHEDSNVDREGGREATHTHIHTHTHTHKHKGRNEWVKSGAVVWSQRGWDMCVWGSTCEVGCTPSRHMRMSASTAFSSCN